MEELFEFLGTALYEVIFVLIASFVFSVLLAIRGANSAVYTPNANHNDSPSYSTYSSVEKAEEIKRLYQLRAIFFAACNAFFLISPLFKNASDNPIPAAIKMIALIASIIPFIAIFLCSFTGNNEIKGLGGLNSLIFGKYVWETECVRANGIFILVLIAIMNLIEGSLQRVVPAAISLYITYIITDVMSGFYAIYYKETYSYFNNERNVDTHIKKEVDKNVLALIKENYSTLGELDGTHAEMSAKILEMPIYEKLKREIPKCNCTNEEYYEMLKNAKGLIEYKEEFNFGGDWVSYLAEKQLEYADKYYDADLYKAEAIKKVFDAIGVGEEPTRENYARFRKTAYFLERLFFAKLLEQGFVFNKVIDENYPIIANGVEGEMAVENALANLKERYHDMIVLKNFRFEYNGKDTTECDFLILTPGGIFCIEVKSYGQDGNYDIYIDNSGVWHKKYGEQLHQIGHDPVLQNAMHAEALMLKYKDVFAKLTEDGSVPPIHQLVVIASNVSFKNETENRVVYPAGLCDFIVNNVKKYDMAKIQEIADEITAVPYPPSKHEFVDLATWGEYISVIRAIEGELSEMNDNIRLSEKYRILK